ncbi:MAG TPA: TonB-dependent receptor [Pseudomonadales bacterium]
MKTRIATAVRAALLGGGACAALCSSALHAQQASVEEITITGTRVRGAEPVGTSVQTIDRAGMADAGQVSIDRMIKDLPQNFDLGVSENSRNTSGGAGNIVYGNTVNLRGIGPYATLILVDGHRVINNSRSFDPSVLPTLGVERVEVIADGSSAIYGSDAIAGVVNLIPRRNLDGIEALGRYGVSEDGDYSESMAGLAVGKEWASAEFMLAFEHVGREALSGDDRDFFRSDQRSDGGKDYSVTRCNPGTLRIGTTTYAIPAGGLTAANAAGLVAGSSNRCDELTGQDLFPDQEYDSFNSTASWDLNDAVTLLFDGFHSKRTFTRQPGYASATLTVPQTNAFFVRPPGFTGTSYQVDYSFIDDLPRDTNTGYARNWEVSPGFRVALPAEWQLDGVVTYGRNDDASDTVAGLNNGALTTALASSDPATAFDPYGQNRTSQSVRNLLANQIFLAPTKNEFLGYELRANGALMELPGGDLALATGYEHQDQDVELGSARGNPGTPVAWREFTREVDSVYAELLLPIVGDANARAGIERLEFTAALRYDDYSDVGDTTNGKLGASWKPTDATRIRASWGTSFRAPLITQIYGNSNALFGQSYQNPTGGAPIQGIALSGPNLQLGPEEATTRTLGFDWDITPDLSLGLTAFDVEYENQVEAYLANLALLSRESEFNGTGIILRDAAAAQRVVQLLGQGITLARGSFPGGDPNNVTLFVDGRNNNLGTSRTKGIDFQLDYSFDAADLGSFGFMVNGTLLTSYDLSITATAPLVDKLDLIFNPLDFKTRASLSWDYEAWHSVLSVTHVGGYTNDAITPHESVSSFSPVDLRVTYAFSGSGSTTLLDGLTIGAEVRNLFDEEPPYVNIAPSVNGSGGYDATAANPIGRLFAVTLNKTW